ncbi:hypothetical protein SH1V18_40770 [Vallitalea longa]|uniref:Uncharacterized protein n=1 Tax=Vallitalea longa TaxID=2936439 RepID=A0A9W5YCS3_9FIRM|nr:DUF2161 family putative PD-(D/E)XK-type phosphodiesterase [Vallitalea longa]GKX31597.1 hypothetical protein SH1V18_40770 [Vallitalea longa]
MNIKETDLYKPIHDYFTQLGYQVNGEVKSIDVTAIKDDELILIELKKSLNMKLLIQGTKGQRLTDKVYLAIERPKGTFSKQWKDKLYLIRRLELGLIYVSFTGKEPLVQIVYHPKPFNRKQSMKLSKKKKNNVISEIEGRYGDFNVGGSSKTKLMTAYKENSLHIACCLKKYGELSPKELRQLGTGNKTTSILYNNFHEWFTKIDRGIYGISDKGIDAINKYNDLADYYYELLSKEEA